MAENPFKVDSISFIDYETMKDLKWHCTKHELKSGQAKTWQTWRQMGLDLAKDEKGHFYKNIECTHCKAKTVHRKLNSLEISEDTTIRANMPEALAKTIKTYYKNVDALFLREFPSKELEIDHRFPQVRWGEDELENKPDMPTSEIEARFMLLTRSNNLLKSRSCEACEKTGKRGSMAGLKYWYEGGEDWDKNIAVSDPKGCEGCYWYNPQKWRESLQKLINASTTI